MVVKFAPQAAYCWIATKAFIQLIGSEVLKKLYEQRTQQNYLLDDWRRKILR